MAAGATFLSSKHAAWLHFTRDNRPHLCEASAESQGRSVKIKKGQKNPGHWFFSTGDEKKQRKSFHG